MHDENIRYSSFIFLQDVLSFLVNVFLRLSKQFSIVHCTQNKTMNSLLFIPLCKLKVYLHLMHMILNKTFYLNHMTSRNSLVSLTIPKLILYLLHIALFLSRFQTCIDHFTYLLSFMIFLQSTTSTFLSLMENPRTLQLRNIYKPLSISLTSLK